MAESSGDSVSHPVYGELRWDAASLWFTQVRLPSGDWLDVIVDPGDGDRFAFLDSAAPLYQRAREAEPRLLREAIQQELLELYNDVWRQRDPELTADELVSRLELVMVHIGTVVPVTLGYAVGDLFAGHRVDVEADENLRLLGTNLVG
jgi:hypothetical protein